MKGFFKKAARFLNSLALSQKRCPHCLVPFIRGESHEMLCPACSNALKQYDGIRCKLCGLPAMSKRTFNKSTLCPKCAQTPPPWHYCSYFGLYDGLLRDMILRLKFDGELQLGNLFGELLLSASSCLPKPDIITAIPQHPAHLRQRGFNQAHEIAKAFAQKSGFASDANLLCRTRSGKPQEQLTAEQRAANLAGAFKASQKAKNLHICLLDDVMTTGATCQEAARALLNAGAKTVSILVVARTPLN